MLIYWFKNILKLFKYMRIIQLIDSLETGGAERMAVNYANALQSKIEFSGFCIGEVKLITSPLEKK